MQSDPRNYQYTFYSSHTSNSKENYKPTHTSK